MILSEQAGSKGMRPATAYRRFRGGTLPVPARTMGRLILAGDLVRDMNEVWTSFCTRLNRKRAAVQELVDAA